MRPLATVNAHVRKKKEDEQATRVSHPAAASPEAFASGSGWLFFQRL
jgi:hypothetical protein